ncbi:MAG: peptidylprolyl isomerase [Anaerolineaceae bacterium]
MIDTSKTYTATLKTEKGDIVIELYDDIAPVTVNSFVFLAREGWYDNVIFHRVIQGFVAQTGDPLGKGYGGPGYTYINEINPDYTFDGPGVVGMANSGEDMNGSQFFISYAALPDLDGSYTVFGRVIEGMDVVESLTERNPSSTAPADLPAGDKILSVEITEE